MNHGLAVTAIVELIRRTGLTGSPVGLVLRMNMDGGIPEVTAMDCDAVAAMQHSETNVG